ncbi:major facilitator superfamily domain-containing protein [Aspergillus keveii]|uniref:Major facilitator superfamily domain-containing protein n=1 Tax=Aspergillus keveii TaxID=714993 RepID=A0ABR4FLX8_9EURO
MGIIIDNSPWTQVTILGFVTFCSVGMYSAISGLGAGGTQDPQLSDIAHGALYGCFAVSGFLAGSVNLHGTRWFLIFAGALLGVSAALFWAAQGAIMMAYPLGKDQGRAFSLAWSIFQLGVLVGASIAVGIQANSTLPNVSTAVYLVFMIIMLTAILTSWLILPPHLVVRKDGTFVQVEALPSPRQEFHAFVQQLHDWRLIALFPMFFSSNYFYAYQGALTQFLFTGRARALASLLTGVGSILGSLLFGFVTDQVSPSRRSRALTGWCLVLGLNCFAWSCGLALQVQFTRQSTALQGHPLPWDWTHAPSYAPLLLLCSYYLAESAYQGLAYYIMSTLTSDAHKLARMAGYYKGVQSAGNAISYGMDAVKTPFLTEFIVSWGLLLISMPLSFWVIWKVRKEADQDIEVVVATDIVDLGVAGTPTDKDQMVVSDENKPADAVEKETK